MTYAAIVEGMDTRERTRFDGELLANPPARTTRSVVSPMQGAELVPLMAAFGLEQAG